MSLLNLLESIGQRNAAIDKGIMASEVDEEHFNQENDSTEPIGGHGQRSDSHWLDAASNAAEETGVSKGTTRYCYVRLSVSFETDGLCERFV